MSEKRKPDITIIAEHGGKKLRVEAFNWRQWKPGLKGDYRGRVGYRIRRNGKWIGTLREGVSWTLTEIFDELRKWTAR